MLSFVSNLFYLDRSFLREVSSLSIGRTSPNLGIDLLIGGLLKPLLNDKFYVLSGFKSCYGC